MPVITKLDGYKHLKALLEEWENSCAWKWRENSVTPCCRLKIWQKTKSRLQAAQSKRYGLQASWNLN